jgi:glutamine cyclotransferase
VIDLTNLTEVLQSEWRTKRQRYNFKHELKALGYDPNGNPIYIDGKVYNQHFVVSQPLR